MPCIGLLPFLLMIALIVQHKELNVSMPCIGLLPFLRYPFKNPLKSMVSGTVFRG